MSLAQDYGSPPRCYFMGFYTDLTRLAPDRISSPSVALCRSFATSLAVVFGEPLRTRFFEPVYLLSHP